MTDVVARVRALLERATHASTPEEEARTSALIAARLIRQHNLVVDVAVVPAPSPLPARTAPSSAWAEVSWADLSAANSAWTTSRSPASSEPSPSPDFFGDSFEDRPRDFRVMQNKFKGKCISCQRSIAIGEWIGWRPNRGATHYECREILFEE